MALDIQPQYLRGLIRRVVGIVSQFHPAGFAPTSGFHLGLDDDAAAAESHGDLLGLRGCLGKSSVEHGHAVFGE